MYLTKMSRWIGLLATLISFAVQAQICGPNEYCVGPVTGPFTYQASDGNIAVGQGSTEAGAIASYKQNVWTAFSHSSQVCSVTLTDNLPPVPPPSPGYGNVQQGVYSDAMAGIGQYLNVTWVQGVHYAAERVPLILTVSYGNPPNTPACSQQVVRHAYLSYWRDVGCPEVPYYPTSTHCYRAVNALDTAKNLGGQCPAHSNPVNLGNPINAATGNKFQTEVDYEGAGVFPLRFTRSYNSLLWMKQHPPGTPVHRPRLGPNWRSSYDRFIDFPGAVVFPTARAYRADGRQLNFTLTNGQFVGDADIADRLERITDPSGNPTGWRYTVADTREVETYDDRGYLTSITNSGGITQSLSYDTSDRLVAVTDSFGRSLALGYDAQGRLQTLTDPNGQNYVYTYNSVGNVGSVTYPDGYTRIYTYNEQQHTGSENVPYALTGIVDEVSNRFSTFKYQWGNAASTERAGGTQKYSFNYLGNSTLVTDPLGQVRTYNFTKLHGMAKNAALNQPCAACGGSTAAAISYDGNGNVSSRTDFKGNVTNYVFDLTRNLETSRTEAAATPRARTITTQWHATHRVPTQIDEPGKRTTFTHDTNGNVLSRTELDTTLGASRTWTYTYNAFGRVLTADGPRTDVSDVTTHTYYSCTTGYQCGQVHTITNAAGHVTTYNTYNAHGQPLTMTDPNGIVTTLTYDLRQRLTSRTVGTEVTSFTYWPTGLLKKATLPDGSYLEYAYDAAHRLTEIEDSEGNRIVYTLDNMGNRTAEQSYDPSNVLTQTRTRVFNTLNRLWKEIGAAGITSVTTTFGYDNNGNQTSIAAPLSRTTGQSFDELNRLTQVTDPLNGTIQYGYNALDQLISVTDPRSKVTSYTYNALGDLTQQVSPDTGTTDNTYDSGGNLATHTDARSKTATYSYDALNRVTGVTYADQTITYTYDTGSNQKGRLTQVTDNAGSTSWSYDAQGRVTSRQQSMGVIKTVGYTYDSNGRLQTMTLPSSNTVTYGYTDGKVTSLTLNGSTTILSGVLYQPFGPTRGWIWGNSTLAIREYDADGNVTDIDSAGLKTYAYDNAFRLTGITDAADAVLSQTYGYDLLDRLTSASGTGMSQSWTYDANGNRLTQGGSASSTYSVSSASNRLTSVSGALTRSYTYDNAGNTTVDGTATFVYNDASRMISATKSGVTTTYALNALGQRVKKTASGSSRYFVYDEAGHLIGEYDNAGNLIQETIWFGDTPVATIKPDGGGGVNLFYIHTDHLNTPRRITRPSDNVIVWRWDSDPFGTTAANEDPDGDAVPFAYNLRFPGQYWDGEAGLNYNYYRDYDPQTGRYIESDPIGLDGGLNTYAYVKSNPLSLVDPFGLDSRAEPRSCPTCWPFPPPTTRPPGGWVEEEWAKDFWDGAKNIAGAIKDFCTGQFCVDRYLREEARCERWRHRGPKAEPNRWYRACLARAAHRRNLCYGNGGKADPNEPPEWSPNDLE